MNMSFKRGILYSLPTLLGVYTYVTPYISIYRFKLAVENKNITLANSFINYPSVKQSLDAQIRKEATYRIEMQLKNSQYSDIKLILMQPLINTLSKIIVDSTINPNGLKILIEKGQFSSSKNSSSQNTGYLNGTFNKESPKREIPKDISIQPTRIKLYYANLNTFILSSDIPQNKHKIVSIWKRHNQLNWLLSEILVESDT